MAKGSVKSRVVDAEPRVRRGYFESRYGQLHVHNAIPPGGGFDEATPLICLHGSPASGREFHRLLATVGRDRSVYAPDLPGFGASDPPPTRPQIADYAAAIGDFCDSMRFRQIDVFGRQSGAFVALELALAKPATIRKIVLMSVPLPTDAEREAFRRTPWPLPPVADGGHLIVEWKRTLESARPGTPLEALSCRFAEKLSNGPNAWWGMHAALQYPARERLGLVSHPTLILRIKDAEWDATQRARDLIPRARMIDLPELGEDALETDGEPIAAALREFLHG